MVHLHQPSPGTTIIPSIRRRWVHARHNYSRLSRIMREYLLLLTISGNSSWRVEISWLWKEVLHGWQRGIPASNSKPNGSYAYRIPYFLRQEWYSSLFELRFLCLNDEVGSFQCTLTLLWIGLWHGPVSIDDADSSCGELFFFLFHFNYGSLSM